jgi:hypothetical protein
METNVAPTNRAAGLGRIPSDFNPTHAAKYSRRSRIACHYARGREAETSGMKRAGAAVALRNSKSRRWNVRLVANWAAHWNHGGEGFWRRSRLASRR